MQFVIFEHAYADCDRYTSKLTSEETMQVRPWHLKPFGRNSARRFTMRPIDAGDAGLLADLLMRLSERSCWLRYSRPRLANAAVQSETKRILRRDGAGAITLVATQRQGSAEEAVALAELVATNHEIAEVAIVVRDDYQGQGLGRALICQIVRHAVSQGLRTLRFDIRRENTAMQCMVRGLGLPYRGEYWPDEICLWVDLPARSFACGTAHDLRMSDVRI